MGKQTRNVVLVTIDAMRRDSLARCSTEGALTPFLNSIGPNCIVWKAAQSSGPYTQAAFPGILTSSYYLDYGEPGKLSANRTMVSEVLQHAGIGTAAFHSNPYLCGFMGWNRGWDSFYDSMEDEVDPQVPYVRGSALNAKVDQWLADRSVSVGDRPFFLWVHYMDIHEPYVPERRFLDMTYPDVQISTEQMMSLFRDVLLKRDASQPEQVALLRKLYDAHVREADGHVERLFQMLDQNGFLKDTAVIVTADHGDEFGEHGGLSHDDKMYSELINVPLLLFGCGQRNIDYPVSTVDVAPTVLDLLGVDPTDALQGASLLGEHAATRDVCYGEALTQLRGNKVDFTRDTYYCRRGGLKLIHRAWTSEWEMYDLSTDSGELHNIVEQSLEFDRMREILLPRVRRWARS